MGNISNLVLSIGLLLMVMGVRFMMVKNSLKAGKPSETRRKTLYGEFWICSIAGIAIFIVGIASPLYQLSVEHAKAIASTGGVLFGLGIPQYVQFKYSKNEQQYEKSQCHLLIWSYSVSTIGVALIISSQFIIA